jgi:hypothetical protein
VIFAPFGLLSVAHQIDARDVVVVANLGPAKAGEEAFGAVGVGAQTGRIQVLVVDPFQLERAVRVIPGIGFVRHDRAAFQNAGAYPGLRRALGLDYGRQGAPAPLANDHNHLARAVLVLREATVPAVLFLVRGLDVAAGIHAVDFHNLALSPNRHLAQVERHRLPDFVREDEKGLVLRPQVARQPSALLPLTSFTKMAIAARLGAEGHLMEGKQRARHDREILAARLAAHVDGHAELAPRLNDHRFEGETAASVNSKLVRGTFSATFLLACLVVLGVAALTLAEL